jgi:hypothetical protein
LKKNIKINNVFYNTKTIININNNNKVVVNNLKIRIYTPNIKIKSIIPEIMTLKIKIIKQTNDYTDVEISKINPLSNIALIINYE